MTGRYDSLPASEREQTVNEAGIRETTLRFDAPVYGALQRSWDDPRIVDAAEPLVEDGYVDAFCESFDTVTLYTPEEASSDTVETFVGRFLDVVADHYTPPQTREMERTGRTGVYRAYREEDGIVVDIRFDGDVSGVAKLAARDEKLYEDLEPLGDVETTVITAEDDGSLQEGVFHVYADVHEANADAFVDRYLERLDEWMHGLNV